VRESIFSAVIVASPHGIVLVRSSPSSLKTMKRRKSVGLPSGQGKAVAAGNARTTARALVTHLAEANHTPMPFARSPGSRLDAVLKRRGTGSRNCQARSRSGDFQREYPRVRTVNAAASIFWPRAVSPPILNPRRRRATAAEWQARRAERGRSREFGAFQLEMAVAGINRPCGTSSS
jgi:hypothetical protein